MRAVLYARVSSDDRGKDGRNLAGQLDMCREHAQGQGWQVVAELAEDDRGVSGRDWDAPQLTRAKEMAERGEFDVLVVREIDRLARDRLKQYVNKRALKKSGVDIRYAKYEFPDTPEGRLQEGIMAEFAAFEAALIAERMQRGRLNKVKAGHVMVHGRPPYGYKLEDVDGTRTLAVHEPEAEIVQQIFEWYVRGNGAQAPLTLYEIGKRLTDMRIPTRADSDTRQYRKRRGQGEWNRRSIHNILLSDTYKGTWHYGKTRMVNGKQVKNSRENWLSVQVPAIVACDLWESAQVQLDRNRKKVRRKARVRYLIQRRAKCSNCGKAMTVKSKRRKHVTTGYYHCPAKQNTNFARVCECRAYWRADQVDAAIWEWLRELLTDPQAVAKGMREEQANREASIKPLTDRLATIEELIAENEQRLERALDAYLDSGSDDLRAMLKERTAQFERLIDDLEREQSELQARINVQAITDEQIGSVVEYTQHLAECLDEAEEDFEIRRQLVERIGLTAEFEIKGDKRTIHLHCDAGYGPVPLLTPYTAVDWWHRQTPECENR